MSGKTRSGYYCNFGNKQTKASTRIAHRNVCQTPRPRKKTSSYFNYCSGCLQNWFRNLKGAVNNTKAISKNYPKTRISIYEKVAEYQNGEYVPKDKWSDE